MTFAASNRAPELTAQTTTATTDLVTVYRSGIPYKVALSNLIGGTMNGATVAEINQVADISGYTETIAAAGAISILKRVSRLALVGAGAVTLAAPDATCDGYIKLITMSADNGDVTLALTNVVGQSSGTTATFNDAGDQLVLMADAAAGKWIVLKERGISLA